MNDTDAIQMMMRCRDEIQQLRRINSELAPKADAYDALRQVLDMMPRRSVGMSEDLVWRLDKEIEHLRCKGNQDATPAGADHG